MNPQAPGDDVCPVPPPVDEEPPLDRFCDLVLTGGVASGVVYPWAIVELARAYRFRNIGGTSVGAMAAALAAAAEYGRRNGFDAAFEPLRRLPGALGKEVEPGRTRMLSLFQPLPAGRRLLLLWAQLFNGTPRGQSSRGDGLARGLEIAGFVAWAYRVPIGVGVLAGQLLALALTGQLDLRALLLMLLLASGGALAGFLVALGKDIRAGVIGNNLGLCHGGTCDPQDPEDERPGLTEWLHQGIQASAGLKVHDKPLTFRDLWNAPMYPGAAPTRCDDGDPQSRRAINLQMITTNVTHGRPYRLPLQDASSRLFFCPDELAPYLPAGVHRALLAVSRVYAPLSSADPPATPATGRFRELPGADMPIVLAARLSLSYPLLFSTVPLYAIDYERAHPQDRALRRCVFTDGGVSSNFPIHLFDAALPAWPTFGLWLDSRGPYQRLDDEHDDPVWLPDLHLQGRADSWNRFDPETNPQPDVDIARDGLVAWRRPQVARAPVGSGNRSWSLLGGFLWGLVTNAKDWQDRASFRMPHVRNRVARLWLRPGEGGLHIGMPRAQILSMAHRYGTAAGLRFVQQFCGDGESEKPAWLEQRWIRLQILINGLRERLAGLSASADYAAHCMPLKQQIEAARTSAPLRERDCDADRGATGPLTNPEADSLHTLLAELSRLERVLRSAEPQAYQPVPEPELRLRAPL